MKQTELNKIKDVSKLLFDAVEIKSVEGLPFLVQHPFTSNSLVSVPKDTESIKAYKLAVNKLIKSHLSKKTGGLVLCSKSRLEYEENLIKYADDSGLIDATIPEGKNVFRSSIFKLIDEAKNLMDIIILLNKPWYMTFLKYTEVYLSDSDLGTLLGECWVMQEYPSRDSNTSLKEIIEWFKRADKHTLMDEEEYLYYKKLLSNCNDIVKSDNTLTLYRGVNYYGKPNGLSWTTDLDKARWFSERFGDNYSRVYKIEIDLVNNADAILAYFSGRGESEIVLDTFKCKDWEVIE